MPIDLGQQRQQAHAYLDRLPPDQLAAVCNLIETMLADPVSLALANAPDEDEEISEEEERAVARSREWFKNNQGDTLEDVAAELGFDMDQIRNGKSAA
jgi:hypothetical protein